MKTEYNGLTITGTPAELMEFAQLLKAEKPKEKKAEPKSQNVKKALDMGKVKALRKAGWTLEKIADEMGVSTSTIANRLKGVE